MRIELDKALVFVKHVKMAEISKEIENEYGSDLHVEVTDDNADDLIVRVRIVNDTPVNSTGMDIGGGVGVEEHGLGLTQEEEVEVGQEDDVFLKRLEKSMLKSLKLRGVDHVKKVFMRGGAKRSIWDDNAGFGVKDEWVLETDGTNLMAVLGIDFVDATRTSSNDIVEVFITLGIEGVRGALLLSLIHI